MCSILLILLLFAIIFDLAHDCAINFDIEEESTQRSCESSTRLVSTSHWSATFGCEDTQTGTQDSQPPPFQRPYFPTEDQQRHGGYGRSLSMALWHMPQIEQESSHHMSKVPCSLELRHKALHRAKDGTGISILCLPRHLGAMGPGLEARGKGSIMVEPKATLGIKTENQKPTQSEGQKQSIRSQRKRREGHWRFLCYCISLWSTCPIGPTVAGTRDSGLKFASIPISQYTGPVSTRCCCYGRGPQGSLPRRRYAASKCEGYDRESREGCGKGCGQRPPLRYQSAQQSPKNACRESRSQAAAPTGFGPIVAKATGRSEKLHA